MRSLAVTLLAFSCGALACEGETRGVFNLRSHHFDTPNGYEEWNLGVGIERQCSENTRALAGVYRNSHRRASAYVGAAWTPINPLPPLHVGAFGGLFSGYRSGLAPAAGFVAQYRPRKWGANLLWFPPFDDSEGLIVLQLTRGL